MLRGAALCEGLLALADEQHRQESEVRGRRGSSMASARR
jgi:hypothetical protein